MAARATIMTGKEGYTTGDHHMGAKSVFLEGSAHIPLLIRPPFSSWEKNALSGKKSSTLVSLADILPTVLNIADKEEVKYKLEYMRGKLLDQVQQKDCSMLKDSKLICTEAPRGPEDVPKWPGFHSTVFDSDVLH